MKPVRVACLLLTLVSTMVLAQTNPVPLINNPLVPDAVAPGGPSFTLTVNGTGFVSSSVVNWNGSALPTTFVSSSQLTATVPAGNIATAGTASVTVVNPPPAGASNIDFFDVRQPFTNASFGMASIEAGDIPGWVTVADLNGDGKQDLITASSFTDPMVYVLLGNGDGTFQSPVSYTVAADPVDIVVADFNGDGKPDLAVSAGTGFVSILLGNGDGTFQPHQAANVGLELTGLAAGDFNGDGKQDLVAAITYPQAEVAILIGNGDGTFQNAVDYAAGSINGAFLATGDFNGDGQLDVAVAVFNDDAVAVLLGNGDGTLQNSTEYSAAAGPVGIVAGDFNGDGKLDLATLGAASVVGNEMSVMLGNGDGTFPNHTDYATPGSGYTIVAADLNGDGKADLLVTNSSVSKRVPNAIETFLGNGDGTFQSAGVFATDPGPIGVAVGDFNGDGMLDIATANTSGSASVLLQTVAVLSKTNVDFGKVTVDGSATKKVTLSNTGNSSFTISRIGLKGASKSEFSESNNCGSGLAAGANCTITLVFKPVHLGKFAGTVAEIFDSALSVPQTIYLMGTGVN